MYRLIKPSDELCHYGVKGMKWGVRRYQNYDGTRIGTGGKPMINAGKQAGHRLANGRNTIAGGQGGKAKGPARLAATASKLHLASSASGANSGSNESKETSDKEAPKKGMFDKSIKQGKGREDISPAEQINKNFKSGTESAKKATDTIAKYDPKVKKAGEKAAKEAKNMSDKELRDKINRIKMEREYQSLAESEVKSGWTKAGEILEVVGDVASITLAVLGIVATIRQLKGIGHSDTSSEEAELNRLLNLGGYDDEFIAHALDLDSEYIEDYLEHHGVKGMKWGVRRYQNYDGTRIGTGGGGGGSRKHYSATPGTHSSRVESRRQDLENDTKLRKALGLKGESKMYRKRYENAKADQARAEKIKSAVKKTIAGGGGPKLAAKSPNSSTSKSVGDALKDTMNEQKELGKAVKDAVTRPLDERRANADEAHKKALDAVKGGLDKLVKDGHTETSIGIIEKQRQKKFVNDVQKNPDWFTINENVNKRLSKRDVQELKEKDARMKEAINKAGANNLIAVWDGKAQHTKETKAADAAIDDYNNTCRQHAKRMVGEYGDTRISSIDTRYDNRTIEDIVYTNIRDTVYVDTIVRR